MSDLQISDAEFAQFRGWLHGVSGISLAPHKKVLVASRLLKRVKLLGADSYGTYFRMLMAGTAGGELQTALDLLTTNETYFFREAAHFDVFKAHALEAKRGAGYRVWSAACSSGEEVYTLAIVLAEALGLEVTWQILGSDISSRVLEQARNATYPEARTTNVPAALLARYFLKGVGRAAGKVLVTQALRERVQFASVNLNAALPDIGQFDVIFLRNVMIYFEPATRQAVVERIVRHLRPGGLLFVSHSESLHQVSSRLRAVKPAVYRLQD